MLLIRVVGVRDPYVFPGFFGNDWSIDSGAVFVTKALPNPKKVQDREGKELVVDREAIAVFGLSTLESLLVLPDPEQESSRLVTASRVPPHLVGKVSN